MSRLHATIKLFDGQFYLEDRNSKFGTLVQAKAGIPITRSSPCAVQVGRTVLDFSVVLDVGSVFRCCLCCCPRNAVAPERAADTFTDNEREAPGEEEDDRADSDEGLSHRSGEGEGASIVAPRTAPDAGIMGTI